MEGPPHPLQRLLDDHADFLRKLSELEAALDEMVTLRGATEVHRVLLDEAIRFYDDELLPHLRFEDESVLPPLEAKIGRFGTLVNVVAYEHDEIRRETTKFKEARRALEAETGSWPAIQELNRHGIFLVQFLWDHFRKERDVLFPAAVRELPADTLDEIRRALLAR